MCNRFLNDSEWRTWGKKRILESPVNLNGKVVRFMSRTCTKLMRALNDVFLQHLVYHWAEHCKDSSDTIEPKKIKVCDFQFFILRLHHRTDPFDTISSLSHWIPRTTQQLHQEIIRNTCGARPVSVLRTWLSSSRWIVGKTLRKHNWENTKCSIDTDEIAVINIIIIIIIKLVTQLRTLSKLVKASHEKSVSFTLSEWLRSCC